MRARSVSREHLVHNTDDGDKYEDFEDTLRDPDLRYMHVGTARNSCSLIQFNSLLDQVKLSLSKNS